MESTYEHLPRNSSMSSDGKVDNELISDHTGPHGIRDFGHQGRAGRNGGTRRGKGDQYLEHSYDNHDLVGSVSPLDDQYQPFSPRHKAQVTAAQGKDEILPQAVGPRYNAGEREQPQHATAFVHPDRMSLVSPVPEANQPTRPQARNEALPTIDVKRKQPVSKNKALSANDGHQWANTGNNNSRGRGRGRGTGRDRGGSRNDYRGGRGRGDGPEK